MKIILIVLSFLFISCAQREELILSEETSPINIINDDIKIISPKFGEVWKSSTTQKIKWQLSNEVKKVQIILFKKEALIDYLAISFPNIGEFNWNIPKNFTNSIHYRIKIIAIDYPRINALSDYFYIKDDLENPN
ncbi:MAG: Ser-Thr-rich GPI-anchored membrane family protein [Stygiobacter sp.]